jgi:uncharacterized membrane protein YccC
LTKDDPDVAGFTGNSWKNYEFGHFSRHFGRNRREKPPDEFPSLNLSTSQPPAKCCNYPMPPLLESRLNLRTRAAALIGQMDWFRGMRAATSLCAPMILGDLAGIQNMGWAGLGGFEAIIADTGGPYRTRLGSLATLSLGGAAGLFLGSIVGANLNWALAVTVLFCFLWSYLAVLGQPFSSAGTLVQLIYICGIGAPTSSWHEALTRSLLLLAGGAWAALLSLILWPLDAYRPARAAVSDCYGELASFLASVAELAGREPQIGAPRKNRQSPALWHRLAQHHQYRVRRSIEQGWQAVASIRANHRADTAQGHHLVVLLENADLIIARTIALAEHFEAQAGASADTPGFDRSLSGLADLRSVELWVADLLTRRRGQTAAHALAKRREMERLPPYLEGCLNPEDPTDRFILAQITEAASLLETAVESAALMRLGKSPEQRAGRGFSASTGHFAYVYERLAQFRQGWHPTRILDQLAANFTPGSLLLRHAARVSLVCGLDVALIFLLHINHGYWLLLTSLIVLQPHVSGTMRRSTERIGGTVAGGILAAVLAAVLRSQLATAAALFPLALLALALLPVSYAAFSFFLTPTFVLAWLPWSGDWQLALVRTANTVAGALISVAAMKFLFPSYERDRAPEFLRASLAADRRYLAQLAEGWRISSTSRSRSSRLLANARRAAGLAHNDTEESLDRLLAESWPRRLPFAQFVAAFVTYLRRLAQSITTLATLEGEWEWKQSPAVESRLELLSRRLTWLEEQTGASGKPSPCPWPEPGAHDLQPAIPPQEHPGERQLERLERQTEVLYRQLKSLRAHGWLPGVPEP